MTDLKHASYIVCCIASKVLYIALILLCFGDLNQMFSLHITKMCFETIIIWTEYISNCNEFMR